MTELLPTPRGAVHELRTECLQFISQAVKIYLRRSTVGQDRIARCRDPLLTTKQALSKG
jgi:hypothetical protein